MTYTIYINANNLTWDIIHKADEIGGMIEQVLDNLISWHDLKENEIEPALDFIRETWGHITVDLCKEIYHGSYVDTPLVKKIDLSKRNSKKTFRITYEDYDIFKKDYVTAETESDALQIAKRIFFPDTSEGFADVYVKLGHIRAEEIKKPEKKSAYYVTIYNEYPIYEPAEGGYYYTGADISESWGFQTFRDAKRFIRKLYKECVQSGDTKSEYWYCNSNHLFFGMDSYYIGEGWFIQLERKQGASVKGWEPYC